MTSRKRTIVAVMLVVLLILTVFLVITDNTLKEPKYSEILEANWGFGLPREADWELTYVKQDIGPRGDGVRYHVYTYEYEDFVDLMFAWGSAEWETDQGVPYLEAADRWLKELDVEPEHYPNLETKYESLSCWCKTKDRSDTILLIWNSEINTVYILESFI